MYSCIYVFIFTWFRYAYNLYIHIMLVEKEDGWKTVCVGAPCTWMPRIRGMLQSTCKYWLVNLQRWELVTRGQKIFSAAVRFTNQTKRTMFVLPATSDIPALCGKDVIHRMGRNGQGRCSELSSPVAPVTKSRQGSDLLSCPPRRRTWVKVWATFVRQLTDCRHLMRTCVAADERRFCIPLSNVPSSNTS